MQNLINVIAQNLNKNIILDPKSMQKVDKWLRIRLRY
jgi:hypothetical protein